jgi:Arc/MetJ-type ribon-helix-helix transcriptional regulator
MKASKEDELEVVSVRVSRSLYRLMMKYIEVDTHATLSDFLRDAIREKLKRDAPWLYAEMIKEISKETQKSKVKGK